MRTSHSPAKSTAPTTAPTTVFTKLLGPLEPEEDAPEVEEFVRVLVGKTLGRVTLVVIVVPGKYPVAIVKTGFGATVEVYSIEVVRVWKL